MALKSIEIDFDIHKMIELERRSFEEPAYVALRRLLNLPDVEVSIEVKGASTEGRPFLEEGISIDHGSDARMHYLRGTQLYEGKFLNGALVVDGTAYPTLSAAASDLARTKDGKKTSLNGWQYWEVRAPGASEWKAMNDLRQKARHQHHNI